MGGMGSRIIASVTVLVAALSLAISAAAGPVKRQERHPYTLGLDVGHICEANVGGACITLRPTDRFVTIDIRDVTGMRVDALTQFTDRFGAIHRTGAVCGKARIRIPDGAERLDVFLSTATFGALGCAAEEGPAWAVSGEIIATFEVGKTRLFPKRALDAEQECGPQAPAEFGVAGVTDNGDPVNLDIFVLLDEKATKTVAQRVFTEAARSYEPLGIKLRIVGYRRVQLLGDDTPYLISQSKALFGGTVPKGADIVYTLTTKSPLTILNQPIAGGQADCIGGIRYPNRSFVVGVLASPVPIGPLTFHEYSSARIAAHEIGHLLGGQHQMANCVQGMTDFAANDPTPCTLMSEFADFDSRHFGTIESVVVRGHAVAYAKP